jgi:hypothetical protein
MTHKMMKPAAAGATTGLREIDQLGSKINPSNNTSASTSQAPLADRVEDDFAYFRRHPGATTRTRLPFPNEFTPAALAQGGGLDCFVHAIVQRNADGTIRRARWLLFVQGGSA